MSDRICAAEGCDRPSASKGWCRMHAERVRRNGSPDLVGQPAGRPMADRLREMVDTSGGLDACWPFTGALSLEGYGRIRTGGAGSRTIGAHRAAFLLANPGITPLVVDHICHDPNACDLGRDCPHRRCCNPRHLIASTPAENSSATRQVTWARLTHCKHGHEFTEANTYTWTNKASRTSRKCRTCDKDRHREARS